MSNSSRKNFLLINIKQQTLELYESLKPFKGNKIKYDELILLRSFKISTAKKGVGSQEGTGCTPLGMHKVAEKIGDNVPINTVFVGRVPTGEVYTNELAHQYPQRDWILTRIMWLQGLESGLNKGVNLQGCCDTYKRYIYIHGTPDSEPMGIPLSHGCIRMRNQDVKWLYDQISINTLVNIVAG